MNDELENYSVIARRPTRYFGGTTKQSLRLLRSLRSLAMTILALVLSSPLFAQTAVKGRVIFEGTPPAPENIEVKSDTPTCGTSKEIRKILLGEDRGVANAVVKIIGAKGTLEPKKGSLDQVNCEFVPHVQALSVGSTLVITSSDPVLHNSHAFYEDGSTAFNIAVPIAGVEVPQKLAKSGVMKLRCDAGHTWMSAYVFVSDEAFYALTDKDGNFTIEGVPPGDYEIEVWQEWLGSERQKISVKEGETSPTNIVVKKT